MYPLFDSRRSKESSLTSSWRKISMCVRSLISLSFGFEPLRKRERERTRTHTICSQQQQQQQQRSGNSRTRAKVDDDFFEESVSREKSIYNLFFFFSEKIDPLERSSSSLFFRLCPQKGWRIFFARGRRRKKRGMNVHFFHKKL